MNLKNIKKPVKGSTVQMLGLGLVLTILIGCGDAVSLEAGRQTLNPLSEAAARAVADGTREEAATAVRRLIASLDCFLDNPECPRP